MDKHAIRIEIGKILDEQCHECPYGGRTFNGKRAKLGARKSSTVVPECRTCPHYERLQSLGKTLITDEFKMSVKEFSAYKYQRLTLQEIASLKHVSKSAIDHWVRDHKEEIQMQMSVEEYQQLKAEHKTDTKIAIVKNISQQTLYNWKKKHENELKLAKSDTKIAENGQKVIAKPHRVLREKEIGKVKEQEKAYKEMKAKYLANIGTLTKDLEKEKNLHAITYAKLNDAQKQEKQLKEEIEMLNSKLNYLPSVVKERDDLKNEIVMIKQENGQLKETHERDRRSLCDYCDQLEALERYVYIMLRPDETA